eukprot:TRINITY_DN1065_c1_g1_i3.p1 TRINITY_DN1065_c1_g1~~TRINITY_DN1065_c1_g1_i3.p1  ORF type:complete len:247 (-),score=126.16 TRINITY_DN1065_c1_g1_i3:415-1155(-)
MDESLIEFFRNVDWAKVLTNSDVKVAANSLKALIESSGADGPTGEVSRVKLVVVGDGAVGKTSLLISYATGDFPSEYVPTVFENYTAQLKFNEETIMLHLWDTAGQEDYDRLRPLSYPGSDIVLLCFSLVSKASYDAVKIKWSPEVKHYIPAVPTFLVGTKVDLRDATHGPECVTTAMGDSLAKEVKALKYFEISSKTKLNLDALFTEAVRNVLDVRKAVENPANAPAAAAAVVAHNSKKGGCALL